MTMPRHPGTVVPGAAPRPRAGTLEAEHATRNASGGAARPPATSSPTRHGQTPRPLPSQVRPPRRRAVVLAGSAWGLGVPWQTYAAALAPETVLVLLPEPTQRVRPLVELVAAALAASGRPVHVVAAAEWGSAPGSQRQVSG